MEVVFIECGTDARENRIRTTTARLRIVGKCG